MSDESQKKERKKMEHQQASDKDAEVTSRESENMEDPFFDVVPDVPDDEYVQKSAVFTPSKEEGEQSIRLRTQKGFSQSIKMSKGESFIVEQIVTPEKGRNFYAWTPDMELFLIEKWATKAPNPFYKDMRGKRQIASDDLEEIRKEEIFRSKIADYQKLWLKLTKPRDKPKWVPEACNCFMDLLDWFMVQKLGEDKDGKWSRRKLLEALPSLMEWARNAAEESKEKKKQKKKSKRLAAFDDDGGGSDSSED